ncbi:MAG: GNAT family N-acetyltransferase [Clostridia bacterium]
MKTEHLHLIPVDFVHEKEIFDNYTKDVSKYLLSEPHLNIAYTHELVNMFIRQKNAGSDYIFTLLHNETNEFLGLAGIHDINNGASLGVWLKISAQGKGYGTECVEILIDYAKKFGIKKLIYKVHIENKASKKLIANYCKKRISDYEVETTDAGKVVEYEVYEIKIAP